MEEAFFGPVIVFSIVHTVLLLLGYNPLGLGGGP
jgi:hypothetical protein